MSAGELIERVAFDQIAEADSSYGITVGDWEMQFECAARIQPLRGSEPVIAQRLTGVQPVVIKVRSSEQSRRVDASWRIRNLRSGVAFNIRSVIASEKRDYIEFLVDSGVGTNQ